jgi:hypothetical protein
MTDPYSKKTLINGREEAIAHMKHVWGGGTELFPTFTLNKYM